MSKDQTYYAGIDIGGTKLYVLITDESGSILGSAKKRSKPEVGFDGVLDRVVSTVDEACADAGIERSSLTVAGVGAPSPILADGTAVIAVNMGWKNLPLSATLSTKLGVKVFSENDVNAGTYGEYALGAGRGAGTLVGLFMGTGMGGGIVIHGELIRGENNMAVELGHMVMKLGGRRCVCGQRGCLEAYASKTSLGKRFKYQIEKRGKSSILEKECKGDYSNVRSKVLARAWHAGDKVVVRELKQSMRYVGLAIGNFVSALGPDVVVLGGGVFEALGEELIGIVEKYAAKYAFPPESMKDTRVVLAELGDDAVALGAMKSAMMRLAQEKK